MNLTPLIELNVLHKVVVVHLMKREFLNFLVGPDGSCLEVFALSQSDLTKRLAHAELGDLADTVFMN